MSENIYSTNCNLDFEVLCREKWKLVIENWWHSDKLTNRKVHIQITSNDNASDYMLDLNVGFEPNKQTTLT